MNSLFLNVLLYGEKVGVLTSLGGDRSIFSFDDAYIENPDRPTLGLAFKSGGGDLITNFPPTQTQLLPWFSNLLPEGGLREYLAQQIGIKSMREYALISALGGDLPGAVTVIPSDEIEFSRAEGDAKETNPSDDHLLKFSLAGVQLKFSAMMQKNGRLTIPYNGVGGNWIIKLPSMTFPNLPLNEFSMMTIAGLMGMNIPEFKLVSLSEIEGIPDSMAGGSEKAFAIRRFDRNLDGSSVHMEDFAQVFEVYPERKYEKASLKSILSVLWIEAGENSVREFIRRIVFNTIIGNADMHLKNWSLIYPDRIHAVLSPGCDFVSTIAYIPDDKAALTYAKTKIMAEVGRDEMLALAIKSGVPEKLVLEEVKDTVEKFSQVWGDNKSHLPLPINHIEVIDNHIKTLAFFRDFH